MLVLHDDIAGLKSKYDADKKLDPPILAAIKVFLIDSIGMIVGKHHRIHYCISQPWFQDSPTNES